MDGVVALATATRLGALALMVLMWGSRDRPRHCGADGDQDHRHQGE